MTRGSGATSEVDAPRGRSQRGSKIGWYLYGVTIPGMRAPLTDDKSVELLEVGGIAAVVARVPLVDFAPDALRTRLATADGLESMARAHNDVVEGIHRSYP